MERRTRRLKSLAREAAAASVKILYQLAVEAVRGGDLELARELVARAEETRKILRMRRPPVLRRGVCKNCGVPLVPGVTARYRLRRDGKVTRLVVTCLACGYMRRYILRLRGDRAQKRRLGSRGARR